MTLCFGMDVLSNKNRGNHKQKITKPNSQLELFSKGNILNGSSNVNSTEKFPAVTCCSFQVCGEK